MVGKEAQERTETVQETARRTDVDVQETPGEARSTGYGLINVPGRRCL